MRNKARRQDRTPSGPTFGTISSKRDVQDASSVRHGLIWSVKSHSIKKVPLPGRMRICFVDTLLLSILGLSLAQPISLKDVKTLLIWWTSSNKRALAYNTRSFEIHHMGRYAQTKAFFLYVQLYTWFFQNNSYLIINKLFKNNYINWRKFIWFIRSIL